MSSAIAPTWGNNSLTSIPHWPYFLKANGDFINAPVFRSVAIDPPGSGWPCTYQHRLGIEAVYLRQPAIHEQEDDVLCLWRVMQSVGSQDGVFDEPGKGHHREAVADATQRFAASDRMSLSVKGHG
jgi:hypothetical protein